MCDGNAVAARRSPVGAGGLRGNALDAFRLLHRSTAPCNSTGRGLPTGVTRSVRLVDRGDRGTATCSAARRSHAQRVPDGSLDASRSTRRRSSSCASICRCRTPRRNCCRTSTEPTSRTARCCGHFQQRVEASRRLIEEPLRAAPVSGGTVAPIAHAGRPGFTWEPETFEPVSETVELLLCHRSLHATGNGIIADGRLTDVLRRMAAFGLTLVRLDVRQEAERHTEAVDAIARARAGRIPALERRNGASTSWSTCCRRAAS